MNDILTLEQYRASRKEMPDISYIYGDVEDGPQSGYIYGDDAGCICLDKDGRPYLVIYNQVWRNMPLEELERILYEEFYLPEICRMDPGSGT